MPRELLEKAKLILKKASETDDGTIVVTNTMGGFGVNTDSWESGRVRGREEAELREAVIDLVSKGLFYDLGKGTVFNLTTKGWNLADELAP